MDILVSAIVGDLMSRSASFVISKFFQQQQPGIDKILHRLQRVVLRIDTVVEEAEGRHITNQGMLRQLNMLRQGMYRGQYMIDALRSRAPDDDEDEVNRPSSSSVLPRLSPAKRLRFSATSSSSSTSNREALLLLGTFNNIREELQRMVDTLEDTMDGMKEFLFFLGSCPRMPRQPYGTYLFLDNCMFGRQTERKRVLDFLLLPSASPDVSVLPIVGPTRVGKSTLVEHVCRDESVRGRFSMILFFPEDSLGDEGVINMRGHNINGLIRHQNCDNENRLLIIVEIAEDIDDGTWKRLNSSATCMMAPCGGVSKIIITSRSDKIVSLGTTEALRLDCLPPEAYWHFFKSLAFGSTDPDKQPKLAAMAMEIALEQRQCFNNAHILAGLPNDNFNAQFWRMILECVRAHKQKNLLLFEKHPFLLLREDKPVYYWRLARSCRYVLISNYQQSDSTKDVPKISVQDIILLGSGGALPRGEFEALVWRSRIPPYYSYTISCIVQAPQVGRKKRVAKEDGHLI